MLKWLTALLQAYDGWHYNRNKHKAYEKWRKDWQVKYFRAGGGIR